jgi:hypothetical protein
MHLSINLNQNHNHNHSQTSFLAPPSSSTPPNTPHQCLLAGLIEFTPSFPRATKRQHDWKQTSFNSRRFTACGSSSPSRRAGRIAALSGHGEHGSRAPGGLSRAQHCGQRECWTRRSCRSRCRRRCRRRCRVRVFVDRVDDPTANYIP